MTRKLHAVVTRPREDAEQLVRDLARRGIESHIEPMLDIVQLPPVKPPLDGVQALLATSRNGVRALARNTARRDIPLYAVGDSTADLARELHFRAVESASGDVVALAKLVKSRLHPAAGPLFHATGSVTAGDLAGRLGRDGFTVKGAVLYESHAATGFSPAFTALLAQDAIDLALFFSPRTARSFAMLAERAGLVPRLGRAVALCLSPAVAAGIGASTWKSVRVAAEPTTAALLAEVDAAVHDLKSGKQEAG